jgi:hypothetical protein
MKKFYMILAALLIGSVCFAQKAIVKTIEKCDKQNVYQKATGYYGNVEYTSYFTMDEGDAIIMRADQFPGANTVGDTIKKIKFDAETFTSQQSGTYNGTSFTLKIYTGVANDAALATAFGEEGETEDLSIAGTCVYTENITATALGTSTTMGTNEIEITPWKITDANYWIVFIANGKNCLLSQNNTISDTITYMQYMQNQLPNMTSNPQMKYLGWYPAGSYTDAQNQTVNYNEYISPLLGLTAINDQYDIVITENVPFFQIYIQGADAYVENSDLQAFFYDVYPNPTDYASSSMTLAATDNLVLYPGIKNAGPDATNGTVTIALTIEGQPVVSMEQPQSIPSGSGIILTFGEGQNYVPFTLTPEEMETAGVPNEFDVCLNVTYTGVDNNTANNTACLHVTRQAVAVEENIADAVSVYPNPANDMFTVANAEGATIVVVNSLGQVVASIENAASNQTIDASNFANGTYFVKVNENVIKINVVK